MFPRPRKITRFLVFILTAIFLFFSYVYIFSSSLTHAPYDVTQQELIRGRMGSDAKSVYFTGQNSGVYTKGQHISQTMDYTFEEISQNAQLFESSMNSKFQNSKFFRGKTLQCSKDRLVTTEGSPKSFSYLQINASFPTKQPFVNPHNFSYLHNPSDICTRQNVSFLIYVHSSPINLKKRQAIRRSWGDLKLLSLFNATLVFILGATSDPPTQKLVNMEANKYGDVVQEDFVDSYRNLTYKGMTALKWVANFCKCAAFVFKADDDVLLDIVSIVDHLLTQVVPSHGAEKLVMCNLWTRMKAMRNKKSKWYLSKEEFPQDTFPPYCSGSFFIFSTDIIPDMYQTALNSKFFWVDDYFITGVLVNSLEIKHVAFNQVYLLNYNVVEDRLTNDKKEYFVFHVRQLSLFQRMWPLVMKRFQGMQSFLQNSIKPFSKTIFDSTKSYKYVNGTTVGNVTMVSKRETTTSSSFLSSMMNATAKAFTFTGRFAVP